MPIYEYQCQDCGHQLEAIRKFSDPPLEECPECGKPGLKKLVSAPSFRLKGGGWYETDFKSGDNKKNLAGDSAADTKAGAGTGGSGDSGGPGDKGKKETTASPDKSDSGKKPAESSKSDSKPASAGKSSSKNQAA